MTMRPVRKKIKGDIACKKLLRPTTGKVREALFNILRDRIEDSRFLDLYAGTGAVGIEALYQGASYAVFVEADRNYAEYIHKILEKSGFSQRARIITEKALSFIAGAGLNNMTFDIIFLDPPYHTDEILYILPAIGVSCILKEEGLVVAEHFKKRQLPERFDALQKITDYKYGDTILSFYKML